jgi:uncharacterized cupredoxin-like copper-binding protein
MKFQTLALTAIAVAAVASPAWGHGDASSKMTGKPAAQMSEKISLGTPGDPKKATRAITVDMSDKMRFTPAEISIRQGETVKLVVKNSGKTMHEFVLGTMNALKSHAELMKKFPDMEHDEPYMAHVAPGTAKTIVWQFTQPGTFNFGCLIPGHFESGMVGKVEVTQ